MFHLQGENDRIPYRVDDSKAVILGTRVDLQPVFRQGLCEGPYIDVLEDHHHGEHPVADSPFLFKQLPAAFLCQEADWSLVLV